MHDLVFISLENNPTMFPKLKTTTKKKIFHSSVNTFDMQVVGSMEEIGKSLSFSEVYLAALTKYKFLDCFRRYFS